MIVSSLLMSSLWHVGSINEHVHTAQLTDYADASRHGLALQERVRVKFAVRPKNREQKMLLEGAVAHPLVDLHDEQAQLDAVDFVLFVTVQASHDVKDFIFDNEHGWNSTMMRAVASDKVVVLDYADNPDSHKVIRSATDTRELCTRSGAQCSDYGTGLPFPVAYFKRSWVKKDVDAKLILRIPHRYEEFQTFGDWHHLTYAVTGRMAGMLPEGDIASTVNSGVGRQGVVCTLRIYTSARHVSLAKVVHACVCHPFPYTCTHFCTLRKQIHNTSYLIYHASILLPSSLIIGQQSPSACGGLAKQSR
jgi:hypothetical protein